MNKPNIENIIQPFLFRHHLVLDKLPEQVRIRIECSFTSIGFGPGEIVFRQGTYPKGAFKIVSGLVKISHTTSQGQRQLIYVYEPGDWIGFRQIITNEAYPIEARTIGNTVLEFIPIDDFQQLLRQEPLFAGNLLETVSHEFTVWVNRLTIFSRFQMRQRLAICLLILHDRFRQTNNLSNTISTSRQDMADFIGCTIETTVRTLAEFKEAGWVKTQGKNILLLDPQALAGIVGEM